MSGKFCIKLRIYKNKIYQKKTSYKKIKFLSIINLLVSF